MLATQATIHATETTSFLDYMPGLNAKVPNKPLRHVFIDTAINSRYSSEMYDRKRR